MIDEAAFKVESNDLSIADILKDFFSVPDFQREYVWEREHVEKLLEDVFDEFYDEEGRQVQGPDTSSAASSPAVTETEFFNLSTASRE